MEILKGGVDYWEFVKAVQELTHSRIFLLVLTTIFVDIGTGKAKAFKTGTIDSSTGTVGIIKHTIITILVVIVGVWCRVLGIVEGSYIFSLFIILEYITSIIENLDVLGIKIPKQFRKRFKRLHDEIDNGIEE